jgi:hypothetical protein
MSLPDCKHLADDDKKVFCPTGYFVPDFEEYGEDMSWYEQRMKEDQEKNDERGVKYWKNVIDEQIKNKQIAGKYALVSGCVWGDDSGGWKVCLLDLSEIEQGKLKLDTETLGYFELPHYVKLKDCVNWEDPDRFNIAIGGDFQFDIDNPEKSGFLGYSFASAKMYSGDNWNNFEINKLDKEKIIEDKEKITQIIKDRISEEYKKHSRNIDGWEEIAARKIYSSLNIEIKK